MKKRPFRKGQQVYVKVAARVGTVTKVGPDYVRVNFPSYEHPFDKRGVEHWPV